jgi:excisionase family DNA binding protein
MPNEALLTVEEVAAILRVAPKTVHRLVAKKRLKCTRFSAGDSTRTSLRFRRVDVDAFIKRATQ